jgi:cell division protein FtsQ
MRRGPASRRAFSRRQWSRRWVAWRRAVGLLVLCAAVGVSVWLVFFSAVLAVEAVEVRGAETLGADRVRAAAGVPVGDPLARVDLEEVRARVEQLPAVRRAEVTRAWPHAVAVTVVERTAIGVVERGGSHFLVDVDGVLFREVAGPDPGLPSILAGDDRAATEAAQVVAVLPSDVARRVERLDAPTMDSITLHLRDGRQVVWGSSEQPQRKAEVLAVLVKREGAVLDVSVPSAPTVSFG